MAGIIILSLISLLFLYLYLRELKREKNLSDKIKEFLDKGQAIPVNTDESRFSHLEGLFSEMGSLLITEKHNRERDRKETREFISDISHQLKTPLAGLKLYCEMEHSRAPTKNTEKELFLIEKTERLISDILCLEKISAADLNFEFTECDIKSLCEAIISDFSAMHPGKHYTVSGVGRARIDIKYFSEAIGNILKNASEHTAENGNISIKIEDSEKSLSLIFEDDGGGVDEAELPYIFKRFHKLKNSSKGSSGIGLSVTKAITEKHHGTVFAKNGKKGLDIIMCIPKFTNLNIKKM